MEALLSYARSVPADMLPVAALALSPLAQEPEGLAAVMAADAAPDLVHALRVSASMGADGEGLFTHTARTLPWPRTARLHPCWQLACFPRSLAPCTPEALEPRR